MLDTSVIILFIAFKVSAKLKAAEEEKNSLENRLEIEMQSRRDMEGRCGKDTYENTQKEWMVFTQCPTLTVVL